MASVATFQIVKCHLCFHFGKLEEAFLCLSSYSEVQGGIPWP